MIAYVFPGQGAQKTGMGQELARKDADVRTLYQQASDIAGIDLLQLDDAQLAQTQYAQLAIVTLSTALWLVWQKRFSSANENALFAGFSLGEYSALAAAGFLEVGQVFDLVQKRARFMQEAADARPGAMYAVIGLERQIIADLLQTQKLTGQVWIANENAPGQYVIAGQAESTAGLAGLLRQQGARRIVKLQVSGAFHTPMMQPAANQLVTYARDLTFKKSARPFYANPTGQPVLKDQDWPDYLGLQMCQPVRWIDEIQSMNKDTQDNTIFLELGPGKVLSGLIRKILPGKMVISAEDSDGLLTAEETISGRSQDS